MTADTYPWLDPDTVRAWVKVAQGSAKDVAVEACRVGAAAWVEDLRRDLFDTEDPPVFQATDRIKLAGLLACSRLLARADSPSGVVSFGDLGAGAVLGQDPDLKRLIGYTRAPKVG